MIQEQNLRYLLLDRVEEAYHKPESDAEKAGNLKRVAADNKTSFENFIKYLQEERWISSEIYTDLYHNYGQSMCSLKASAQNIGYPGISESENAENIEEVLSHLEVTKLPKIFEHLRKIADSNNTEYEKLLDKFIEFFKDQGKE